MCYWEFYFLFYRNNPQFINPWSLINSFFHTTICVQPWSVNVFSRRFTFQTRQFHRQLSRLDQWKCFVWSTKVWMFSQRNVARLGHAECSFDKINDIFHGFGSLVSLRFQKNGGAKSIQIWTNLSHWNTGGSSSLQRVIIFLNLYPNVQLPPSSTIT